MHDVSDFELDADDDWARYDAQPFSPTIRDSEYEHALGDRIFIGLSEAFPGQVQVGDVTLQPGNYTIYKEVPDEAAKNDFPNTALPELKQEILRQANDLGGAPGDYSVQFDVDAFKSRQRGNDADSHASISVLVVEGPVDPDLS